jgi:hypothetical protein
MTAKQDTTESLIAELLEAESEAELLALVQRLRTHCYRISQPPSAGSDAAGGELRWFRDLLAVIHRDGGHHTERVGTEQSAEDATRIVSGLLRALDEAYIQLAAARDEVAVLRATAKESES